MIIFFQFECTACIVSCYIASAQKNKMKCIPKKKGPDFICIGLPKAGTTWIASMLSKHPQVYLPDKEIRYFWEKAHLGENNIFKRLTSSNWHYRSKRNFYRSRFLFHLREFFNLRIDIKRLMWDLKYMVLPRSDKWYLSLFDKDIVSGDISPIYHVLEEREIEYIGRLLPDTKIIIMIRNQVEREWSRAKMVLCKNRNKKIEEVSEDAFVKYINKQKGVNNYIKLIGMWKKYFGEDKTLIVFYDELIEDSVLLLEKLCNFLDIDPPNNSLKNITSSYINKGISGKIPYRLEEYLFHIHRKPMMEQVEFFPHVEYPQKWLKKLVEKYN